MTVTASITMSKMGDDDFENIVPDQSATDITDLPQYNIGEDVDLTLTPQAPSLNEDVSESLTQNNNEEISNEQLNNDIEINNTEVPVPEMEQLVVEQPIVSEEPKVEKEEINNKAESVQPEIPEVEMEYPTVKPSEPEPEVKFEGIINNSEYETTILQSEGEFVEIPLSNGEVVFVQYGDNAENVPEEITVKYVGTDMYIYSPIVNTRVL